MDARANTWTLPNSLAIHCFSFITSKYMSPRLVYKCLLRTLGDGRWRRETREREGERRMFDK